jgi:hypothetical protein
MVVVAVGCPKKKPIPQCFDVVAGKNSAGTRAVFDARHCQEGGVTWGAILSVLAERRGRVEPVEEETPGWGGGVYTLNGQTRFSIDDEGDAAQFCSDDPSLLAAMRGDYNRLNGNADELKRAMAATTALALECNEPDGTPPQLPALAAPPELPPETVEATRASLERLKLALKKQPDWCFPPDDPGKMKGLLRFLPDGRVMAVEVSGKPAGQGRWKLPNPERGDDRMEVILEILPGAKGFGGAGMLGFDLGKSGRIGFEYIDDKITRMDMVPGDGCLFTHGKVR